MRISYSALDTFQRCPAKYKFQYLDRLKTPERPELYFGSLIHEVVQYALKKDPIIPEVKELLDFYKSKWRPEVFPSETVEKQYKAWGENMLRDFHAGFNRGLRNIVATEKRFQIPLNDKHILSGMIDRVDKLPLGSTYEVIDYKTGKTLPTQDEVAKDRQLATYHFAVQQLWPEAKEIRLTLYFLKHGSKLSSTRQPFEVEEVKAEIIKTADKIEKETEFAPKANYLCDWCDYAHLCPIMKQKVSEIPAEPAMEKIIEEYLSAQEKIKDLEPKIHEHFDQEKIEAFHHKKGVVSRSRGKKLTIRKI